MNIPPREGIQTAFAKIDELCSKSMDAQSRLGGLTAEAARLRAYSTFLSVEESRRSAAEITSSLERFIAATNSGTTRLVLWTKVMAIATGVLALVTIAQLLKALNVF